MLVANTWAEWDAAMAFTEEEDKNFLMRVDGTQSLLGKVKNQCSTTWSI